MYKKRAICLLFVFILFATSTVAFSQDMASNEVVDKSNIDSGLIAINYSPRRDTKTKVMISKDNEKYTYDLKQSDNRFPLQFGNGKYTICILENVGGDKYKVLQKEKLTLQIEDENQVYLQSIQNINWNDDMKAAKKAKELTKDAKDDEEKVAKIYDYIINNICYDNEKAKNIKSGYIPNIDETMKNAKGICYDYAALFAGMLRSVHIPTKLIMGYRSDMKYYHAWNEVYLKDMDKWITIDTTFDAGWKGKGVSVPMVKDSKDYSIKKQY